MPSRTGPSFVVIVLAAILVVIAASAIGATWGAKAFIAACLVGSVLAGLLITSRE